MGKNLGNCSRIFLDPVSGKLLQLSGGKIKIKKVANTYIKLNYQAINFPQSILTIVTSAAENIVVGVSINNNNKAFSFEAVSVEDPLSCCNLLN